MGAVNDPSGEIGLLRAEADAMTSAPNGNGNGSKGLKDGRELWDLHPHIRKAGELTFGERAADVMRNAFGSWVFVGSFLLFMGVWIVLNSLLLRHSGWDKYPYILLNLCLSMMAGLQGALILIAAKRADRVSAEQALAHYAETAKLDALQTNNNAMTERIETATNLLAEIHDHICGPPERSVSVELPHDHPSS